ncbi:hypothetical protein [Agaribacter marinus]|uniref:Uncharacterized protein n=1 Tax=Agaribacter marinus TaxID=1431249 RepID=A0AA37SZ51_9ALTE|nr:hypothetical protein [Agaribacter marinus]GLR71234.1 hypothetical protein GCM10007852_21420 [Agaribacter marinus]
MKKLVVVGLICFLILSTFLDLFVKSIRCGGTLTNSSCTEMEQEFMGLIYAHPHVSIFRVDNDFIGVVLLIAVILIATLLFTTYKLVL